MFSEFLGQVNVRAEVKHTIYFEQPNSQSPQGSGHSGFMGYGDIFSPGSFIINCHKCCCKFAAGCKLLGFWRQNGGARVLQALYFNYFSGVTMGEYGRISALCQKNC